MLLQTNSYIVPKERRAEHARLMRRFRQILNNLGCDNFEVYEQVGANWSNTETSGRFVQIMRFRDRKHQLAVQNAERSDPAAQQLIAEFVELVNYPYQQQQGQFAVGFYSSVLPVAPGAPSQDASAVPLEQMSQEQDESLPAEMISDSLESPEGQTPVDQNVAEHQPFAAPEQFATEDEVEGEDAFQTETETEAEAEAETEVEGFIPDEQDQIEAQAPLEEAAVEEAHEEPAPPPRPVPSPDADLDADLDIPDDDLARLADELAAGDGIIADAELDHNHAHGRNGGRGSENGHS
jgi:hypothetical protein